MTIKDKTTGKELTFELLSNGILKAYDYVCGWDVTFKRVRRMARSHEWRALGLQRYPQKTQRATIT